jgi:hypothetical protein
MIGPSAGSAFAAGDSPEGGTAMTVQGKIIRIEESAFKLSGVFG